MLVLTDLCLLVWRLESDRDEGRRWQRNLCHREHNTHLLPHSYRRHTGAKVLLLELSSIYCTGTIIMYFLLVPLVFLNCLL